MKVNKLKNHQLEEQVDKKYYRQDRKKKGRMKVSGSGARRLARIIKDKAC
jgi:hypothetical protein